jgi:hypothetical protein
MCHSTVPRDDEREALVQQGWISDQLTIKAASAEPRSQRILIL